MNYSKIKSIRVKNFNCVGDITIDFSESPIISLVGDNDSGKSSVIDGFTVASYHANPNNQKDSIRDGTVGFGVMIELEDGHTITRIKTAKTNEYQIEYPDGTKWNTDKIDVGAGVPLQVQELMGCIKEEETKEFLHVRTYRDLMLFVTTSAGTNYKVMYGALKAEHISKAIKNGSARLNALRSFKNEREIVLDTLEQSYADTKVYDITPVTKMRDRINSRIGNIQKLDKSVETNNKLIEYKKNLGKHQRIIEANLEEIDTVLLDKLLISKDRQYELEDYRRQYKKFEGVESLVSIDMSLIQKLDKTIISYKQSLDLKKEHKRYENLTECKEIDITALNKIESAIDKNSRLQDKREEYVKFKDIDKLPSEINLSILNKIEYALDKSKKLNEDRKAYTKYEDVSKLPQDINMSLITKLDELISKVNTIKEAKGRLSGLQEDIEKYTQLIKESGIKTAVCGHCGHDVYVE